MDTTVDIVSSATEQQIRATLHTYCTAFDRGDFDTFAGLFEKGRWFMVDQPGPRPVRDWITAHVHLYESEPRTRHEITNLLVDAGDHEDEVSFCCYLAISQHLAGSAPELLVQARFSGTFTRSDGVWWWHRHDVANDYTGDLSNHLKGGLPPLATPSR